MPSPSRAPGIRFSLILARPIRLHELFRQQERWAELATPAEAFASYAEMLQLDTAAFDECLASDRHADVVSANSELARLLHLNSVPTILITVDGETRAASDRQGATIARVIDEMTR